MSLIDDMKKVLPMYAYPTQNVPKTVGKHKIIPSSRLEITSLMDAEHEGGIMCGIEIDNKILLTSLTYLVFKDEHPLRERINEYQMNRINLLKTERSMSSISVRRNEPCACGSGKKYKKCCGE